MERRHEMNGRALMTFDAAIGFCMALVWMTLVALARQFLWPDLWWGWVLVAGGVAFVGMVWLLAFVQAGTVEEKD